MQSCLCLILDRKGFGKESTSETTKEVSADTTALTSFG
jgi:hypothetical protein